MIGSGDRVAGSPLRPYQRRATDALVRRLAEPGSRACLVAPPGAGKTRCAIHTASALGGPAHILAPTRALVDQWRQRLAAQLVDLGDGAELPVIETYAGLSGIHPDALVVLDEAHHLVARWGRDVEAALSPRNRVLGLTATPPFGHRGWETFTSLVGEAPVEIDAPPLVKEAHLSPYLDLVWPVLASPEEAKELAQVEGALRGAERRLGDALDLWIAARLREDLFALTEARFAGEDGLLIALCRARASRGLPLPLDLPPDPDLTASPTLHDRALTLWAFAKDHPEAEAELRDALTEAGFRLTSKGAFVARDVALSSLCATRARVEGLVALLVAEEAARTDWLRALVVTERDVEGSGLSARAVLKALVADPRTDALDPILVTGTALWVDDDLWPRIAPHIPELPTRAVGDHHEIDVAAWPVEERIALVTRFMHEGLTRCLVGTRHLLGEGWDCPPINCVVDLTGIARSVTVNQIRGRGMRIYDGEPGKVATLWEIVAIVPGVAGGERMLESLAERHRHTLGLDGAGRIRAGLDRIDPALIGPADAVAAEVDAIRGRMVGRLERLEDARSAWAVGEAYLDRRVWQVDPQRARRPRTLPPGAPLDELLKAPLPMGGDARLARVRRRTIAGWGAAAAALAAALGVVALVTSPVGWAAAGALVALGSAAPVLARRRSAREEGDEDAALSALHDALLATGQVAGPLRRDASTTWVDDEPGASHLFAEAAAELLNPLRYPRYLLVEPRGWVWPVPAALGADRGLADAFAGAWAARVGPCEVVFARQGRGRALLVAAWRGADRRGVAEVIERWQ